MANICPGCGANLELVGRVHRCIARAAPTRAVAVKGVKVSVAGMTYRYRDPGARRAYMRELMRRRRLRRDAQARWEDVG
jgi:hypothetical protein